MGAGSSSTTGVLQSDAVGPSRTVLGRQSEPRLLHYAHARSSTEDELQRLQAELRRAKSDAQKAARKLAQQEEQPELILAPQAGTSHQSNQRAPWEHADWARSQIERIYAAHRPEKLSSVDLLMQAWVGSEDELLAQLQAKYQLRTSLLYDSVSLSL